MKNRDNDFKNSKFINNLAEKIEKSMFFTRKKIEKNIRFELMIVIGICFAISFIFYNFTNNFLKRSYNEPHITYDYDSIERDASRIVEKFEQSNITLNDGEKIDNILKDNLTSEKIYITNLDGKIIKKTANVSQESIDIYTALKNAMSNIDYDKFSIPKEKNYIVPLKLGEDRVYLIYSKIPESSITYTTISTSNSSLALLLTCMLFIVLFVLITNSKMKYLDEIAMGLKIIASGNLNYRIKEVGKDEIRNIAFNINNMAQEIGEKIKAERCSEKTKAELITNVSHDLRTPLTSIMGYIGLVLQKRYKSDDEMNEYLNIAFSKSERLKFLIDDLFEYTKLNNNGLTLSKNKVNLKEFLCQLIEEFTPMVNENGLEIYNKIECDKLIVSIDTMKMLSVFENLLTNAVKYAYKPGEIIVGAYNEGGYAIIVFRNKGEHLTKEKTEKLFDRFYRVDESRNTNTGGSGLGLAISKSIVELHGGKIWADSIGDNITFYIKLKLEFN